MARCLTELMWPLFFQIDPQSSASSLPLGIPAGELLKWSVDAGRENLASYLLLNYCQVHVQSWCVLFGLAQGISATVDIQVAKHKRPSPGQHSRQDFGSSPTGTQGKEALVADNPV